MVKGWSTLNRKC